MDEPLEELEPLFDYSRVQPPDFIYIDDDADDSSDLSRKRNRSDTNGGSDVLILDGGGQGLGQGNKDDEEDWLAPPPKRGTLSLSLEGAAILEEIRLNKQELQSLACSTETLIKEATESAKREFSISASTVALEGNSDQSSSQPPAVQAERAKIVISLQDKEGIKQFRLYKDEKLEKVFKLYAEKVKAAMESLVFIFDGDKVSSSATPNSLGMEDDDMIEVHVKTL